MNHTQQRRRRPLVAMPGYALAMSWKQQQHDRRDAQQMRAYLGTRAAVKPEARRKLLAYAGGK